MRPMDIIQIINGNDIAVGIETIFYTYNGNRKCFAFRKFAISFKKSSAL